MTEHKYDSSHPKISSPTWNRSLYSGGESEYIRLQQAMSLDRKAALLSASYGRYQIMGFNYNLAGYEDVEDYVRDAFISESNHLSAFVRFILNNKKLSESIKNKDWPTFARYYNGSGYKENKYDLKLESAYEKYSN